MSNWTPDRPTKTGKYWLSVAIPDRERFACAICREVQHVYTIEIVEEGCGVWLDGVIEVGYCLPESAKFLPYVEPPDPFAEPVPKPVEQLISDAELVKSAIQLMRTPRRKYSRTGSQRPLWSRVMLLFGHGSTYSRAICRAHGFDPDEVWMIEESPQ